MRLTSNTEWLFFHLWKKNPENNKSCPGVIFKYIILIGFYCRFYNIQVFNFITVSKDGRSHFSGILQQKMDKFSEKLKKGYL